LIAMHRLGAFVIVVLSIAVVVLRTPGTTAAQLDATPEARAVSYLQSEVPRWRREHSCYSCHNNGDATRALLAAAAQGHDVGPALDDTLAWLASPEQWEQKGSPGGSSDLPLARVGARGRARPRGSAGRYAPAT
jgi:hypothetical protein